MINKDAGGGSGSGGCGAEDHQQRLRALAARTVTDSLRAAVARSGAAADKAARLEECARSLEAEKAKMEVFRRELPISVHLIADGAFFYGSTTCYVARSRCPGLLG